MIPEYGASIANHFLPGLISIESPVALMYRNEVAHACLQNIPQLLLNLRRTLANKETFQNLVTHFSLGVSGFHPFMQNCADYIRNQIAQRNVNSILSLAKSLFLLK